MPANSLSLIRIVDDDAEMRESLEFLLSTEGWKSRSYASAEAFLETDDVMVPGCLILDIRMPGLSGLQLQEVLKKKDYSLPILFITAHGDITMPSRRSRTAPSTSCPSRSMMKSCSRASRRPSRSIGSGARTTRVTSPP